MRFKDIPSPRSTGLLPPGYLALASLVMGGMPAGASAAAAAPAALSAAGVFLVFAKACVAMSLFVGGYTALLACAGHYAFWQGRDMLQRWSGQRPQVTFVPALVEGPASSLGLKNAADDFRRGAAAEDMTLKTPVAVKGPLKLKPPTAP